MYNIIGYMCDGFYKLDLIYNFPYVIVSIIIEFVVAAIRRVKYRRKLNEQNVSEDLRNITINWLYV